VSFDVGCACVAVVAGVFILVFQYTSSTLNIYLNWKLLWVGTLLNDLGSVLIGHIGQVCDDKNNGIHNGQNLRVPMYTW
jgi:hypothetical protein